MDRGRALEQRLYAFHFENGSCEAVVDELRRYQNADGGFGHALEPDVRIEESSGISTTVAMQIARQLGLSASDEIVSGAIRYFLETFDAEAQVWMNVPPTVDNAPHAPWWAYQDDPARLMANPRAEIVGYLIDHASIVPAAFATRLLDTVLGHLDALPDDMDMHDLLCFARLAESEALDESVRERILVKLRRAVDTIVVRDPIQWKGYVPTPLTFVDSPVSPFAALLKDEVESNLDYLVTRQGNDGASVPDFSWGGTFPEVWGEVKVEWKGIFTLNMLHTLRNHGRLD